MEKVKTRIIIEQADGLRREYECRGYAAMLFDCERVTRDGKGKTMEATVVADDVSNMEVMAVMMCDDNPFGKAHVFLKDVKEMKLPWSLRRKMKKMLKG